MLVWTKIVLLAGVLLWIEPVTEPVLLVGEGETIGVFVCTEIELLAGGVRRTEPVTEPLLLAGGGEKMTSLRAWIVGGGVEF